MDNINCKDCVFWNVKAMKKIGYPPASDDSLEQEYGFCDRCYSWHFGVSGVDPKGGMYAPERGLEEHWSHEQLTLNENNSLYELRQESLKLIGRDGFDRREIYTRFDFGCKHFKAFHDN